MKRRELRVVRGNQQTPFSPGAIVESLQSIGVATDEAIRIARQLEKQLRASHGDIPHETLMGDLVRLLERELGREAAERFKQQTPPFVPIRVRQGNETTPFSRRVLAASLHKRGLGFKEAHAVAKQVEQSMRSEGYEEIGELELGHLVALAIETRFGREARLKYEAGLSDPAELVVVEKSGARFPYSRGILAQSLMAIGLGPELSHTLAKHVEDALWRFGKHEVSRETVRRVVTATLKREAGEEFARRYELMRVVRQPDKPLVILIGGAPGVGKSTLASELGYRLGISRIVSSDSVREALRSLISAELSPALHASSYTAWRAELLPGEGLGAKPKRKRVIRGFQRQVQQLITALSAVIKRNIVEHTSVVMEGIHLVPGFMPLHRFQGATVVELVLAVFDEDAHRNYFSVRETQTQQRRTRQTYLEHFNEIRILQDFIVRRAKDEGVPVLDASNFDQAVDQAIEHIMNVVLAEVGDESHERTSPANLGAPQA